MPNPFSDEIGLFTQGATFTIPAGTDVVKTTGHGAIGVGAAEYVYDASVNSAFVAAHPGWSFVSFNGRGFRLSLDQELNFQMFGAVPSYSFTTATGTDNYPAWLRMRNFMLYFRRDTAGFASAYLACPDLRVPFGAYYFSDTPDLDFGTIRIVGEGGQTANGGYGSVFMLAPGKHGMTIQGYNTTEETSAPEYPSGTGSIVERITVWSKDSGGVQRDGFRIRTICQLWNCNAIDFSRDGVSVHVTLGAGGPTEGNGNTAKIWGGTFRNNGRDGIHLEGADSNAIEVYACDIRYNGRWGLYDNSFLGGPRFGIHFEGNSQGNVSGPSYARTVNGSMCTYGGNRYCVAMGQATAASTTQPGTNNNVWIPTGPGGEHVIYPTWSPGKTWVDGGSFCSIGANARSVFIGPYVEPDQGKVWVHPIGCVIGGHITTPLYGPYQMGEKIFGGRKIVDPAGSTLQIGYYATDIFRYLNSALGWEFALRVAGSDVVLDFANLLNVFAITGANTGYQFGKGVPYPYAFVPDKLIVGGLGNGREHLAGPTHPSGGRHARGEICWNNNPAPGQPMGWICTTAGEPGAWTAMPNL